MHETPIASRSLVLRTCNADLSSHGGFAWPSSGPVAAPDWSPVAECGHGLHGALWGEGNGKLFSWDVDAKWLVVEVDAGTVVDLRGKVKFPAGNVVFCGDRLGATSYLAEHGGHGRAIIGGTATAGDGGSATVGYGGTATAGSRGTAMAGSRGTAMAGSRGILLVRFREMSAIDWRVATGYIGEGGLKPNTPYRFDGEKFVEVIK